MKKLLTAAVLLALMVPSPSIAALQTNAVTNNSNEWAMRSPAHFYRKVTMSMGSGQLYSSNGSGAFPQQMTGIGKIYSNPATLSSSTTGAQAIGVTLPANTFRYTSTGDGVGKVVHIRVYGTTAANGNTKQVQLLFGTQTITLLNAASNAKDFYADISIFETGANAQQINVAGYANAALFNGLSVAGTQTVTSQLNIQLNLPTATANSDVVVTGFEIYGES